MTASGNDSTAETPPARPAPHGYVRDRIFVGGQWQAPGGESWLPVHDCSTEVEIGRVRSSTPDDVHHAVLAAQAAFARWRAVPPDGRSEALLRLHRELAGRAEELAAVISAEVGTALGMSRAIQVASALHQLEATARLLPDEPSTEEIANTLVVHEPVGVVGAITPWNYPLFQTVAKVAGALAAGCTVVHKPSELAPLSTFILAEAVAAAGLPDGVYNVVTGPGPTVGEALASHPGVRMVSFTGSTAAGTRVYELAAHSIKRVALELGGKSASVLLDDADLARAVKTTVNRAFLNSGQTCDAWTRLVVPRRQLPEVLDIAVAVGGKLTLGDPFDPATRLGPLVSARQRERVRGYLAGAARAGASAAGPAVPGPAGVPARDHPERCTYVYVSQGGRTTMDVARRSPGQPGRGGPVTNLDGPTLRAVRESIGVPLRRIARQAGMSHGHLSKVERGEHGRPVTPAIMAAYERVTGVKLAEAAVSVAQRRDRDTGRRGQSWRPGQLTDMRRQAFNAAIGAIAIGGHLGEPTGRLLDSTGRPVTPTPPELVDVDQLVQVTDLLTGLDLRYGGGLVSQLCKALLRWAVVMLDAASMTDQAAVRLSAAVSALAARAGWAAFDTAAHEAARSLFRLALYTAARAGDPDLRAHVLADVAAQHNQLGYHFDALEIIRLAEGDERVAPGVRVVLHGVKARAYAAVSEFVACRQHVELAESAYELAGTGDRPVPEWVDRLARPAQLSAITGHALATVAYRTGDPADLPEAEQRLAAAVAGFDPTSHARARALCLARLAGLHLAAGDLDQAARHTRQALQAVAGVRSARLTHAIAQLRTAVAAHPDRAAVSGLVEEIDASIGTPDEEPDPGEG